MAKFVIAGSCDCPYFAKLELLTDELSTNLQQFKVHKVVLAADEWEKWLSTTCSNNGWVHKKSPIVWRELVDRGGKGMLMGGFNEFLEYAQCYYGVTSDMMTDLMLKIKEENIVMKSERIKEEAYFKSLSKPLHICIVNASNPLTYHILPGLASGEVFGSENEITIRLLDNEAKQNILEGLYMEVSDLAHPMLRGVSICFDAREALKDTNLVIFLEDGQCDEDSNEYYEKLNESANKFQKYAEILDEVALPETKVIVAGGGFVNFDTYVLIEHTQKLDKQNIVAAPRMQELKAKALLSRKLSVNSAGIKNIIVWGNCASNALAGTTYVDISSGCVQGYNGAIWGPEWFSRPLTEMVYDKKWLTTDFLSEFDGHKADLEKLLNHEASMSEATSLITLLHDWINGSASNELSSLGVKCEGWYKLRNCVFSLPVRFSNGTYQVVWDLDLDSETTEKLSKIEAKLRKDIRRTLKTDDEECTENFGEDSDLISSMLTQVESSTKSAGEKLEAIQEEDAEEQPQEIEADE